MTATKKVLLFLLSFTLFVVSVCPTFAYAAETYNCPFSQPQLFDGSGYMEVLFQRSNGSRYIRVFQWQTSFPGYESVSPVPVGLTVNKNGLIKFQFVGPADLTFFTVISICDPYSSSQFHFNTWQNISNKGYVERSLDYDDNIVSYNIYGSYSDLTSDLLNSYIPAFTVTYGDDTSLSDLLESLDKMYDELLVLHSDNLLMYEDLEFIISQLNALSDRIHNDLDLMNSNVYYIAQQIKTIVSQLNDFSERMHVDITSLYDVLINILYECREYFVYFDEDLLAILDENIAINEKLDRIIEILEMQGESVQTTVDSSNIDEAVDIENSLLDNSNVDVSDVINVEVNQNALTVIWDLVEKFLNSHGKVFGMVLTVLSLGLVAMILGRKV